MGVASVGDRSRAGVVRMFDDGYYAYGGTLQISGYGDTVTGSTVTVVGAGSLTPYNVHIIGIIEDTGATELLTNGVSYSLQPVGGSPGVPLYYQGAPVAPGQFGGWTPIGAEAIGDGYQVAWKKTGGLNYWTPDEYIIWTLDGGGNLVSMGDVLQLDELELETKETIFAQDLNGDSTIGPRSWGIETDGDTTLSAIANAYQIDGQILTIDGVAVKRGQFRDWMPIAGEATDDGYQVAWRSGGPALGYQYIIWTLDGGGARLSMSSVLSGSSFALQSQEAFFAQDLNDDGALGPVTSVIEGVGSTTLSQAADVYQIDGHTLHYRGAPVTSGQFGGWTPIGAEASGGGYALAWKMAGLDQYIVWTLDGSGHLLSMGSTLSGGTLAFQSQETAFAQDLNGDGTTGPLTTAIETDGTVTLSQVANTYQIDGHTLHYRGAPVTPGQFGGWTPIGAEASGGGYALAWKMAGLDQYIVWTLDGSGHLLSMGSTLSGSTLALQSQETFFGQDLNGDGTTGILTTVIEAAGATTLAQAADTYGIDGHTLHYRGAPVTPGQFGGWTPIGAEASGSGYALAWKMAGLDQYIVWTLDGSGHLLSMGSTLSGGTLALQSQETAFGQDLNGDGTIGPWSTVIDGIGATTLAQVADTYRVDGHTLHYRGAPVTPGQFGGWTPIGAEASGSGYQLAWKMAGLDQYIVWTLDGSGHLLSMGSTLSGGTLAFQSQETFFGQDLNGDGTIGPRTTVIESSGATTLGQVADTYLIDGHMLHYRGAPVTPGQFGGWTPIGTEAAGSGYQLAWKMAGTDQYIVWTLDGSGHLLSMGSTLSGRSLAFQSQETFFGQDLNGDGTIGPRTTVIESSGATTLGQVADTYLIDGHTLHYRGAPVTSGQFGGWTPIGTEAAGGGYQLAWKMAGTDQYIVWTLDGSGHLLSMGSTLSGGTLALQSQEIFFDQDLNGDGTIGPRTTVIESSGTTTLAEAFDSYRIGSQTLKYGGVAVPLAGIDGWKPIGAEATGAGYQLVLKKTGADAYVTWNVDSSGNFVSRSADILSGGTTALQSMETVFAQDLNGDGTIGLVTTVVEAIGNTHLIRVGGEYYFRDAVTGIIEPSITATFNTSHWDASVLFTALGVERLGPADWIYTVYEVMLFSPNKGFFTTTTLRTDGVSYPLPSWGWSIGSVNLQEQETLFGQDFNGDGLVGRTVTTIEGNGTSLYVSNITGNYLLGDADGPQLKIGGVAVTSASAWQPVAVEWDGGWYDVVLKANGSDQYVVVSADSAGNITQLVSAAIAIPGSDFRLQLQETYFDQDINGDGVRGIPDGVIEDVGSAKLVKEGNAFYVYQDGSSTGVQVKNANGTAVLASGVDLTSSFVPVGVEWTAEYGFQIVTWWLNANTYRVEDLDASGKYKTNVIGSIGAGNSLFETVEDLFQQDLDRDHTIGHASTGAFDIDIHVTGNTAYRLYFEAAAARWEQIITADIPDAVSVIDGPIDDLRIDATVEAIDGLDGVLGYAGWDELRDVSWLPMHGTLVIDTADIGAMKSDGTLLTVIIHEIGHTLGLGSLWDLLGLTNAFGYVGHYGLEAYRQLSGNASATFVPLETSGGAGTAGVHWSEDIFGNELLTGYLDTGLNPLSILTIAALRDLGYTVDTSQAELYTLPA
jgi:hypothetical protein